MSRRSKADWLALISEQESSGLTAAEYCRQQDINEKYFSVRKRQLSRTGNQFVKVTPVVAQVSKQIAGAMESHGVKLRVIEVELPLQVSNQSGTISLLLDRLLK